MDVATDKKVVQTTTATEQTPAGVMNSQVEEVRTEVADDRFVLSKLDQIIWLIIGLIELLIIARFVLLLLGANMSGFVRFIYDFSGVFVAPFFGMFDSPRFNESFFDTASLVAIVVWLVIGLIASYVLKIFDRREV